MTAARLGGSLALAWALALSPLVGGTAQAAVLGVVDVTPLSGTDETLLRGGLADARCPAGTADSYFSIDGPDLPRDQAILAPGNPTGTGPQTFQGVSIANVRATSSGSFARSGTYRIRFSCVRSPDGVVSDTYERELAYVAGGRGSFTIEAAPGNPQALPPDGAPPPDPTSSPAPTATAGASGAGSPAPSQQPPTGGSGPGGGQDAAGGEAQGEAGTRSRTGLLVVVALVAAFVAATVAGRKGRWFGSRPG